MLLEKSMRILTSSLPTLNNFFHFSKLFNLKQSIRSFKHSSLNTNIGKSFEKNPLREEKERFLDGTIILLFQLSFNSWNGSLCILPLSYIFMERRNCTCYLSKTFRLNWQILRFCCFFSKSYYNARK